MTERKSRSRDLSWLLYLKMFLAPPMVFAGWFAFFLGVSLFWAAEVPAQLRSWFVFQGHLGRANGVVSSSNKTDYISQRRAVYVHEYQFIDHKGKTRKGRSYKTGQALPQGKPVVIEYRKQLPQISRIMGQRATIVPLFWGWLSLLLPFVGVVILYRAWSVSLADLRLLRHGEIVEATVVGCQEERVAVTEEAPLYRCAMRYYDARQQPHMISLLRLEKLEIRSRHPLVVLTEAARRNSRDPEDAPLRSSRPGKKGMHTDESLLEDLAGHPTLDTQGRPVVSWPSVLLPLLFPVAGCLGLWWWFFG